MTLLHKFPNSWLKENPDTIKTVLEGCQKIFNRLEIELKLAKQGLSINSATSYYLDAHGDDFHVSRGINESDNDYRIRVLNEVLKQRNTINSIIITLNQIISKGNYVYEPFHDLFTIGESTLSGDDKITDYGYWDYHVIDVLTRIDPKLIEPVLAKIVAAGKTYYISFIIDAYHKHIVSDIEPVVYHEIYIDNKIVNPNNVKYMILDAEYLYDFQGIGKRILWWTPCLSIDNFLLFDNVPMNYQNGIQIINQIEGVDY